MGELNGFKSNYVFNMFKLGILWACKKNVNGHM